MQYPTILLTGVLVATVGCATRDAFTTADVDQSGSVASSEFDTYMKRAVFDEIDSNHDDRVTAEEWQVVNPTKPISGFHDVDKDGDGVTSRTEANAHFDGNGTLRDLFAKIDADQNGSLSRAEADAFRAQLDAQSGATKIEKLSNAAK